MSEPVLVTVEMRFVTSEDPDGLAERIQESVRLIVGGEALEEFRTRVMPLTPPKKERGHLREV
ncbi:MAG: hypothetical protein WD739_06655 [Actinomycetota bacterium]